MEQAAPQRLTFAEYLSLDRAADRRHEFVDGWAVAMAGGSRAHAELIGSAVWCLRNATIGSTCRVYSSDLRLRVLATGRAYYPDGSVVCGPVETDPEDSETVTNPVVVVEVLSKSTEADDRGSKWQDYQLLPSLQHYLLVSQWSVRVEHFRRGEDGTWTYSDHGPGEEIQLDPPGVSIQVDDLFRGVQLSADSPRLRPT
ncbi:MAG: Uma2 family endonuclease [Myxococcales bacterium]|nr:Uma2 family endonuclease [Myxococcales bacterium]